MQVDSIQSKTVMCKCVSISRLSTCFLSDHLLLGVVWQAGAGSKHWPVVLYGETLQLGPESLLLLRHHTVSSTLKRHATV